MSELHTEIITFKGLNREMFKSFISLDDDFEDILDEVSEQTFHAFLLSIDNMNGYGKNQDVLDCLYHTLEDVLSLYANDSQFILGNQNYTDNYSIQVHMDEKHLNKSLSLTQIIKKTTVFIAWVGVD